MPALVITAPSGTTYTTYTPSGKTYTRRDLKVQENTTEIFTATANKPVTWSIIPVPDSDVREEEGLLVETSKEADFVEIDSNTGVLKFKLAPDYENPKDALRANNYDFYIQATDNSGNTVRQRVEVLVTDVDEQEIAENIGDNNTSLIMNSYIINKITRTISSTTQIYFGKSSNYNFYNLGEDRYALKTDSGYDEITGVTSLQFSDKTFNLEKDIAGTFDQVTGKEDHTGQMFRLYNAAFARFPDADGLEYWIEQNGSGINSNRQVAQSFLASDEFSDKYGDNVSTENYVKTLYNNILGRDPDPEGYDYWVGRLSSGAETRAEALLGFAESAENKALFSDMTGLV